MKFTPKTDEEINRAGLIPDGTYDFTVVTAEDTKSKKGNDMIKATLRVFVGDRERLVTDYLLEAMAYKLKHFCGAVGLAQAYLAGEVTADTIIGTSGKVVIETETQDGFPSKSVVGDYVDPGSQSQAKAAAKAASAAAAAAGGDAVPF